MQLGRRGNLEDREKQEGAGTAPLGVDIDCMEPQEVGIDPVADNNLGKHKAEPAGNIGLGVVDSIQVVLVVRHILLGVDRGMDKVVGQVHRLVDRAIDALKTR